MFHRLKNNELFSKLNYFQRKPECFFFLKKRRSNFYFGNLETIFIIIIEWKQSSNDNRQLFRLIKHLNKNRSKYSTQS